MGHVHGCNAEDSDFYPAGDAKSDCEKAFDCGVVVVGAMKCAKSTCKTFAATLHKELGACKIKCVKPEGAEKCFKAALAKAIAADKKGAKVAEKDIKAVEGKCKKVEELIDALELIELVDEYEG